MSVLCVDVGIFASWKFRNYLKKLKFIGYNIEWVSTKNILSEDFIIKSDADTLDMIKNALDEYNRVR